MPLSNTGNYNTASGFYALYTNVDGSYNTAVGCSSNVSSGSLVNAMVLGFNAIVDASNKVRIGNTSVTSIGGEVAWTAYSDGRFKKDVSEDVQGLTFITRLRPVTYRWDIHKMNNAIYGNDNGMWDGKYDIEQMKWTGFIAQDVEQAASECNYDFSGIDNSGDIKGLRYAEFVVPLVKAVQELETENAELRDKNADLESRIERLERIIETK